MSAYAPNQCSVCKQYTAPFPFLICDSCRAEDGRKWWEKQRLNAESVRHFYAVTLPNYYAMTSGLNEPDYL